MVKEMLKERIETVLPTLNEKQRRIYLASEAMTAGYGGVTRIHEITGVSRSAIQDGIREIKSSDEIIVDKGRIRRMGGGRKKIIESQPEITNQILDIVEAHTKGDPESVLRYTSKSLRNIAGEVNKPDPENPKVSPMTVGSILRENEYTLQSNRKEISGSEVHPDRDSQFEYISKQCKEAIKDGKPVLSIDAKKKENIGNFKNNGVEYHKKGESVKVLDHDFPIKELGKATPYGIYNIFKNEGFVNVGISSDTSEFAVNSIRKWWEIKGQSDYCDSDEIIITADSGGSNGNRNRLWKTELQNLADELGKKITVLHYPAGTSKWNKIEHRLFSFISRNWRGRPLGSLAVIVSLIGSTKTSKGLTVDCIVDGNSYEKGIKISDSELDSVNIYKHLFHGDWNYTIFPRHHNH